jgi:N-acetylmuramoyl-L-alanine amidase
MPALPQVPRGQIIVIVDPGHGGPDPGAVGIGGIQEKEIVLDISKQVAQLLQKQGVRAILTRENDIDLDLQPRVDMAEQVNATLFVSIHANSIDMSRPDVSGLETYYFSSGEQLARTIHRSVLETTGISDRRVRQARFFVLRKTSMPSVLVEVGFVTGRDDATKLSTPSYRSQMAASIARGILQYLRQGS